MKRIIHSLEETKRLAQSIALHIKPGMLITLSGDLGAGKTTFTKYLGEALGVKKTINSPTFTILKVYQGKLPLYHIDAYRMEGISQDLGFDEYYEGDGLCIIEWPNYIIEQLPNHRLEIELVRIDEDCREVHFKAIGKLYEGLLEELK